MYIGLSSSICLLINNWYIARSKGEVGMSPRLQNLQGYLALPVSQQQSKSERSQMQPGCGETGPGRGALTPGGHGLLSRGSHIAAHPIPPCLPGSSQQLQACPPPASGKQQTPDFPLNLCITRDSQVPACSHPCEHRQCLLPGSSSPRGTSTCLIETLTSSFPWEHL